LRISKEQVEHVALLARVELTGQEKEVFVGQLSAILEYMQQLDELDTSNVEPMTHAVARRNVLRPDEPKASLPSDLILSNAPSRTETSYKVPRVIE